VQVGALVRGVRMLATIETVESVKLATKIDHAVDAAVADGLRPPGPLRVMIQVQTPPSTCASGGDGNHAATTLEPTIF